MLSFTISKSVVLKADLNTDKIRYRPVEDELRRKKLSSIAIGSVSYKCAARINSAVSICCNHVTSRKYNVTSRRVENYEVPLTVFQLKTTTADNLVVSRITPQWFDINTLSEIVEFNFINMETDQPLVLNGVCAVMIGVFFKYLVP